jgi:hypothetical protein
VGGVEIMLVQFQVLASFEGFITQPGVDLTSTLAIPQPNLSRGCALMVALPPLPLGVSPWF